MQGDLISRSALIKEIEKSMKNNPHSDGKVASVHQHEHRHFLTMVMQQPTSYDVEKVIEQLKENSQIYCEEYHQREGSLHIQDTVEIVRNGGKE